MGDSGGTPDPAYVLTSGELERAIAVYDSLEKAQDVINKASNTRPGGRVAHPGRHAMILAELDTPNGAYFVDDAGLGYDLLPRVPFNPAEIPRPRGRRGGRTTRKRKTTRRRK